MECKFAETYTAEIKYFKPSPFFSEGGGCMEAVTCALSDRTHTHACKHLHMLYARQRFIGMFRRRGRARGTHKACLFGENRSPLSRVGTVFLCLHIYVHVQMCVGVFWAVTCNIHHPHCQRHGEISQDSKSHPPHPPRAGTRSVVVLVRYFGLQELTSREAPAW